MQPERPVARVPSPRLSGPEGPDGQQVKFRWFVGGGLDLDEYYCLIWRCDFGEAMSAYYPIRMWAPDRREETAWLFNASDICVALGYDRNQPANWAKRNEVDYKPTKTLPWPGGRTDVDDTKRKATTLQHPGISIGLEGIAFTLNEARRRQTSLERVNRFRQFMVDALGVSESELRFFGSDTASIAVRCVEGKTLDIIRSATSWAESQTQVTMCCGGKRYRVDCYYPHQKLVVECDEAQHNTPEHRAADQARAAALSAELGLRVIGYRPFDGDFNMHAFIGYLSHILVQRSAMFNLPLRNMSQPKPVPAVTVHAYTDPRKDSPAAARIISVLSVKPLRASTEEVPQDGSPDYEAMFPHTASPGLSASVAAILRLPQSDPLPISPPNISDW